MRSLARAVRRRARHSWLVENVVYVLEARYGAYRFRRPVINGHRLTATEPEIFSLLQLLLPSLDGVFIDVGANLGQTLAKVRLISPEMPYVGIEPDPFSFSYLGHLARVNDWSNLRLSPVALADDVGLGALSVGDGAQDNQVVDAAANCARSGRHVVPIVPGDLLVERLRLGPISVLKIDVEGAELRVLEGMGQSIQRFRPVIIVEILPPQPTWPEARNSERLQRARDIGLFAVDIGYTCHRMDWKGHLSPSFDLSADLSAVKVGSPPNYVLCPGEMNVEDISSVIGK